MPVALERALRDVRDTLLEESVSPRVEDAADIDCHYCLYVAETAIGCIGDLLNLMPVEDGVRGWAHSCIVHRGRHSAAAIHVEPGSVDQASVRNRGLEPLYPDL